MRLAILTIVSGEKFEKIWKRTQPFFENYADKIGADLIVLSDATNVPSPHWIKFAIYEFLKKDYDRVAFIDADILIRPDAPSIFDEVPEDKFGIFNEGRFTPRALYLYEIMQVYGMDLPKWDKSSYYNTGVMVVSRAQRHIFSPVKDWKPLRNSFGEQTYLNYRLFDSDVEVQELEYTFKSMSIMTKLTGMSRLDSYFVHYAGWPEDKLFDDMDNDIAEWKSNPEYKYKRNIFVYIGGGIGDQMCAEPLVRYLKEFLYPDANIFGLSSVPRLYDHIEGITIQRNYPKVEHALEMNAHPSSLDNQDLKLVHPLSHGVDYVSVACIRRILPDAAKEFKLKYYQEDIDEVWKICEHPEELVVIHPGVGWPSKTFPIDWWQKVIDGIERPVAIIGKELLIDGDGTPKHSYLPVECPENGFDFRNKLSLGGLIYLLSQGTTLVSNDSAPIHLAGAFDNNIVLIPTCKHPDYVLPYRQGSKYHKAWSLCKKTLYDDNLKGYLASDLIPWRINECDNILNYLPEPEEVITLINSLK